MTHAVPERFGRLARQGATRSVGNGARNPDRQGVHAFVLQVLDRLDAGLAVQRVGDGLDQIQVDPALVQRPHLLTIGLIDLVEGHQPSAGIVHVRRHRQHLVQRPDRSGGEARLVRLLLGPAVGRGAGQLGALQVDVPHRLSVQRIVFLRDGGRRKGVGLADVRARAVVLIVQVRDDVRPGDAEDVVVPLHLVLFVIAVDRGEPVGAEIRLRQAPPLDHHAPAAVQHQDAFPGRCMQGGDAFDAGHPAASRTPSTRQMA